MRRQLPANATRHKKQQFTPSSTQPKQSTQVEDQAVSAASQCMRLANAQLSALQPRQDLDKLTEAEIDLVCEKPSAPCKSDWKRVPTERALQSAQQTPVPVRIHDSTLLFFASFLQVDPLI
jgi:hypothetical protein